MKIVAAYAETDPIVYPLRPNDSWASAYSNFYLRLPDGFTRNSYAVDVDGNALNHYYAPLREQVLEQGQLSDARWNNSSLHFFSDIDAAFMEMDVDAHAVMWIQEIVLTTKRNVRDLLGTLDLQQPLPEHVEAYFSRSDSYIKQLQSFCNRYVAPVVKHLIEECQYNTHDLMA